MQVNEIIRALIENGIKDITVNLDEEDGVVYYNLNTQAKSHLLLREDYVLKGRYDYESKLDPEQDIDEILRDLFWEFRRCIHGRDFYSADWMELGVKLGCVEKKVTTTTHVTYE